MRRLVPVLLLWCLGVQAHASNVAFVVANQDYEVLGGARGAVVVAGAGEALEDMGFHVFSGDGLSTEEIRAQLSGMHEQILRDGAERVVVVLAGRFGHSRSGGWFMGREAEAKGLALADGQGLRLDIMLEIAALATDSAVIWLGDSDASVALGNGLEAGLPQRLMAAITCSVVMGRV